MNDERTDGTATVHIGHDELVVRQRYEVASIVNDLLIGIWLMAGHVLLFSDALEKWGLALLLVGSLLMMVRPVIRLARRVHLQRLRPATAGGVDVAFDY